MGFFSKNLPFLGESAAKGLDTITDPLGIADAIDGYTSSGVKDKSGEYDALISDALKKYTPAQLKELKLEDPKWLQDLVAPTVDAPEKLVFDPVTMEMVPDSEMKKISIDPRLREAQLGALNSLKDVSDSGGMTLRDKANLSRMQSDVAAADRGRRGAIMQNMAARGAGGSGMELVAQMQNAQAATDREAQAGLDIAAQAQERALQAIMQQGQLGGSIRGQDFGEQSQVANAQDAINRFNTGNTNQGIQFNAGRSDAAKAQSAQMMQGHREAEAGRAMRAGEFNAAGRQNTANMGVDYRNKATTYNTAELPVAQAAQNNRPIELEVERLGKEQERAYDKYKTKAASKANEKSAVLSSLPGLAKTFL
jgi:hypothetical protein